MKSEPSTPPQKPSRLRRLRAWLFRTQTLRLALVALTGLITLIAIFYTEENWRGKRAWERYKHELEAKGQELDWAAYIPKPIPDDQNIFKAPKMSQWFIGRGQNDLSRRLGNQTLHPCNVIAEVTVIAPDASAGPADADITDVNEQSLEQVRQLLQRAAEQNANSLQGPSVKGPQLMTFFAGQTNTIKPVQILLRANKTPSIVEMSKFCSASSTGPEATRWMVQSAGSDGHSFRVLRGSQPVYTAADFLAWSDQFETDFNTIREALKRPYAVM